MGARRTITGFGPPAAGIAIVAAAIAPIVAYWLTNEPDQRMVDLDVYRSGGQAVVRGFPVYDVLTQPPQLLPFTYPPFAVLLAIPLTFLPWAVAQWTWAGLVYLALAITVRHTFRDLFERTGRWTPLVAGALVAMTAYLLPLRDQIRFGQVDILLVAMCVADCSARSPRWPRGLLVGLATAIKLVPGVFLIYFLVARRWREAVVATATAAIATLATFLVLPADSVDFWLGALLDSERLGANTGTQNQSMRGMLMRLYLPDAATSVIWLACVAAAAYIGFRTARKAYLGGQEMVAVAIVGLLAVLLSPVAWIHHLAWVVVVLGALVGAGRSHRRIAVAAVLWLLYVLPTPWWGMRLLATDDFPAAIARLLQSSYGLGTVVMLLTLGWWVSYRMRNLINTESTHLDTRRAPTWMGTL